MLMTLGKSYSKMHIRWLQCLVVVNRSGAQQHNRKGTERMIPNSLAYVTQRSGWQARHGQVVVPAAAFTKSKNSCDSMHCPIQLYRLEVLSVHILHTHTHTCMHTCMHMNATITHWRGGYHNFASGPSHTKNEYVPWTVSPGGLCVTKIDATHKLPMTSAAGL